jgi:hypothetical protein
MDVANKDLKRPHEFAFERVGYFLGESNLEKNEIAIVDWLSFGDEMYQRSNVGAEIGREGMKYLMRNAFQTNMTYLHFHLHLFQKKPTFSFTDIQSIKEIVPALFSFSSASAHGAIILGSQYVTYEIWLRNQKESMKKSIEIARKAAYERKK